MTDERLQELVREFNRGAEAYLDNHDLERTVDPEMDMGETDAVRDTTNGQTVVFSIGEYQGQQVMVLENIRGFEGVNASNGISQTELNIFKAGNPELYAVFEAAAIGNRIVYQNEQGRTERLAPTR